MMKKIELEVKNITQGFTQHHSYAVVLQEAKGKRRLPIVIGAYEAQAIAVMIEQIPPVRPLTHDLFKNVLDVFSIFMSEIVITNLLEGVFYSKLICIFNGEEQEIDSRTSDAIALALRFGAPIYIYEDVLDQSGILLVEEEQKEDIFEDSIDEVIRETKPKKDNADYDIYTNTELEKMMNDALAEENYEKAAKIRDELHKRK